MLLCYDNDEYDDDKGCDINCSQNNNSEDDDDDGHENNHDNYI